MRKLNLDYIKKNPFLRNILVGLFGTVGAQALPILLSPVLTRMYSPAMFGVLGLFMSLVSIFGVLVSLGYSKCLLVPKRFSGFNLLIFICGISFVFSCVLLLIFGGITSLHLLPKQFETLHGLVYVLPLSIFLFAMYDSFYCWVNRHKRFKTLGLSKIVQSFFLISVQLLLAFFHYVSFGLVAGYVVGQFFGVLVLFIAIIQKNKNVFHHFSMKRAKLVAKRYMIFPVFTLPAELISSFSGQLPTILFTSFFSLEVVGIYHLTSRVLSAPISLLSSAVTDVFRERAAQDFRENGDCRDIFMKTFKLLILLGIGPSIVLFIFSPKLFPFIFGSNWKDAGIYAQILTPLFFIRFVVSPLSYVLYIAEKIKYDLVWQTALLIVTAVSLYIGIHFGSPKLSILLFSVSYSIMYGLYFLLSYKFAKSSSSPHL